MCFELRATPRVNQCLLPDQLCIKQILYCCFITLAPVYILQYFLNMMLEQEARVLALQVANLSFSPVQFIAPSPS